MGEYAPRLPSCSRLRRSILCPQFFPPCYGTGYFVREDVNAIQNWTKSPYMVRIMQSAFTPLLSFPPAPNFFVNVNLNGVNQSKLLNERLNWTILRRLLGNWSAKNNRAPNFHGRAQWLWPHLGRGTTWKLMNMLLPYVPQETKRIKC